MAFKNALKMLATRFGLIWVLLLYIAVTALLVASLSIPFAVPVVRTFRLGGRGQNAVRAVRQRNERRGRRRLVR